jgi:pimeloyl-ACP methyl ester carboxylesterase
MKLRWWWLLPLLAVLVAGSVYQFRPDLLVEGRFAAERWRAGAVEREIVVDDHRWRYLDAGNGPPLVLVHGFSGSKENWLPAMAHVDGYRMIAVDLPGWAESQRIDGVDYGVEAQAARLARFIAALSLDRPVVAGHSMGGHIGGVFAARHPDQLSRLVLVASAGVRFVENDFARRVFAGETPFNAATRDEFATMLHLFFADPPWLPPRAMDVLLERNIANHAFHRDMIDVLRRGDRAFLLESELHAIRVPVAVLWGADDRTLDVSSLDVFRRELPAATITVLPGVGHMPMMERPRETARVLAGVPSG